MPNKFQPWFIWLAATTFVFFQFLLQTSTSVMVPAFMRDFHIDPLQVGILSSSYFYSYLTLQLPSGMLVDKFGARVVLSVGIILCAIACWLFGHATDFYQAEFSRILMGIGSAPVIAAAFGLAAHWFPNNRFALIIGLTDTIGMAGGITGQAYLAYWVASIGWRQTMLGCFIAALIITVVIGLMVRDKPYSSHTPPATTDNAFVKLKALVRSPQIWLHGIFVAMVWGVAIGFTGLWSVLFLQTQYHLSLGLAASASSMVFLGIALATPIIGWLADTFIHVRRKLMLGCTVAALIVLSITLYCPHLTFILLLILLFLFGCCISSYIISFAMVREITAPESRATAMGFTNMMSIAIGAPVLQPLIGYFLKGSGSANSVANSIPFNTQNFQHAFLILPVCLIIALISLIFIKPVTVSENLRADTFRG